MRRFYSNFYRGLRMTFGKRMAVLASSVLIITGCSLHEPMDQAISEISLDDSFSQTGLLPPPEKWWLVFEDPRLNDLMEVTLQENRTIQAAWARMEQFSQVARISRSGLYPSVDATLSADRQRSDEPVMTATGPGDTTMDTRYAGVTVAYQVDLWRKLSHSRKADFLGYEASRQDLEATLLAMTATVAELWFSLSAQIEMLTLLEAQLEVSQEYVDLVESRFANGLVTAMDVYFQRLQLAATERQIPMAKQTIQTLKHQLAVLLGRQPGHELTTAAGSLKRLPELPHMGIPVEVLRMRPDVRGAELRLIAADHRVSAAIADRFPNLGITITGGGQAEAFSDILENWFVSLGANLLAPIFDAGRRKAEVERSRAVVEELFASWESALLDAFLEVEDALVIESGILSRQEILARQLKLAGAALARSRSNYVHGLTDYLNVLTSLQSLYGLQLEDITFRLDLLTNRVRLYAALGGGALTLVDTKVEETP